MKGELKNEWIMNDEKRRKRKTGPYFDVSNDKMIY